MEGRNEKMKNEMKEEKKDTGESRPVSPGILNLTQHKATAEQIRDGVIDLPDDFRERLISLLTFEDIPNPQELYERAYNVVELAREFEELLVSKGEREFGEETKCLIGGAPFFMSTLERGLFSIGYKPVYAFSRRESEEKEIDGKVIKTQVFKHLGFVEVRGTEVKKNDYN
jgi:hypothetical protein